MVFMGEKPARFPAAATPGVTATPRRMVDAQVGQGLYTALGFAVNKAELGSVHEEVTMVNLFFSSFGHSMSCEASRQA